MDQSNSPKVGQVKGQYETYVVVHQTDSFEAEIGLIEHQCRFSVDLLSQLEWQHLIVSID